MDRSPELLAILLTRKNFREEEIDIESLLYFYEHHYRREFGKIDDLANFLIRYGDTHQYLTRANLVYFIYVVMNLEQLDKIVTDFQLPESPLRDIKIDAEEVAEAFQVSVRITVSVPHASSNTEYKCLIYPLLLSLCLPRQTLRSISEGMESKLLEKEKELEEATMYEEENHREEQEEVEHHIQEQAEQKKEQDEDVPAEKKEDVEELEKDVPPEQQEEGIELEEEEEQEEQKQEQEEDVPAKKQEEAEEPGKDVPAEKQEEVEELEKDIPAEKIEEVGELKKDVPLEQQEQVIELEEQEEQKQEQEEDVPAEQKQQQPTRRRRVAIRLQRIWRSTKKFFRGINCRRPTPAP
ncbi:hypothetical protein XELAEV_18009543mg [Xenopus laevis]|uniref:Uncharacterized protein n=1 Tax=Xenopus laevis TaxID=8355 RepID=A0A974DUZ3_XENLA|nr:hypothetical protein XELAEV_18009543mg [Xenopus laevis]